MEKERSSTNPQYIESGPQEPLLQLRLPRQIDLETGLGDSPAVLEYLSSCKSHGILPCADLLIRLQLRSSHLVIHPESERQFGNLEMRALAWLLELNGGELLANFQSMDFSLCRLGTSGVLLVAHLLCLPSCRVEELDLSTQEVGPEGAQAIVAGIRKCSSLRVLRLHTCKLGKVGGKLFLEVLQEGENTHQLRDIDLQNNFMGTNVTTALQTAGDVHGISILLFGNRVLEEVFNAVTHGLGFGFAIVATVFLGLACRDKPSHYLWGIIPYCMALIFLFMSSMLYHSFHALGPTVNRIFCTFDHFAIYCLIAGTYTPFLVILFHGVEWANMLLSGMWCMALLGAFITICYNGRAKVHVENTIYLLMGWAIISFANDVITQIGWSGFYWLLGGGVLYTMGVPWFIKDGKTLVFVADHTVWHIFVLGAAACHFLCIYWYIALPPPSLTPFGHAA